MEALVVELMVRLEAENERAGALEFSRVQRLLFALHFAQQVFLDAVGQVFRNLILGAAQQKRAHPAASRGFSPDACLYFASSLIKASRVMNEVASPASSSASALLPAATSRRADLAIASSRDMNDEIL